MSNSRTANEGRQKRPWLAAVLAVVVPGLGHIYIRMWGRALLWFLLYLAATQFFLPEDVFPETFSTNALTQASEAIPPEIALLIIAVAALNVFDAYLMTARVNRPEASGEGEATESCPNCGKTLDSDLDFCHWCTTRLDGSDED